MTWLQVSRRAACEPAIASRCSCLRAPSSPATLYACWRIGAVVVVADAGLGLAGLGRALRGASPDHVIGIRARAGRRGRAASARAAHRGRERPDPEPACAGRDRHARRPGPARPRSSTPGRARPGRRVRGDLHLRGDRPVQGRGVPAPTGPGAGRSAARHVRDHCGRPAGGGVRAVRAVRADARRSRRRSPTSTSPHPPS